MPVALPLKPQRVQLLVTVQGLMVHLNCSHPEVTYALSHSGGQSCMAPNGKLQNAPAFSEGRLITCKDIVADSSDIWSSKKVSGPMRPTTQVLKICPEEICPLARCRLWACTLVQWTVPCKEEFIIILPEAGALGRIRALNVSAKCQGTFSELGKLKLSPS